MNTIGSYAKLSVANSRMKNSLKKNNNTRYGKASTKKNTSSFQSVKYLNRIAAAKSQQQVRVIINSLKKEISKAKNCENYNDVVRSINKVRGKAEVKIAKLASERVNEKKREKAELEHKIEERKKQDKILKVKRRSRKRQENFDIYDGAKDDAKLLKSEVNNILNDDRGNESLIGKNFDKIATSEGTENSSSSTVDTVV
jgi:predicted TIM-barrel fold metal-dependent hydrolase